MTRKAFVHIGFPKTGTTAIQMTLAGSREALRNSGLTYPGTTDDHSDLIALFHPKGEDHFYFGGPHRSNPKGSAEKILIEISENRNDVILSSEYLHNIGTRGATQLYKHLSEAGFDTFFVCYLRHPIDAAVSSAQQSIKMGDRSMEEVISAPKYTKIRENIEPILNAIGKENLIVRDFNVAKEEGLIQDFMSVIGYPDISGSLKQVSANESVTMDGAILADMHRQYEMETGKNLFPKSLIFSVGKGKFDLPPRSKNLVQETSQDDIDWVEKEFGMALKQVNQRNGFHPNPTRETVVTLIENSKTLFKHLIKS